MSKVEELLQEINDTLEDTANSLYPSRHRDFIGLDDVLEQLISAAREEGRAEERERIVCGSQRFPKGEYVVDSDYISMVFSRDGIGEAMTDCELFIIPASLLAPAPKEEGK